MTEWGPLSCEVVGRGTVHQWRAVARLNGIQDKVIRNRVPFSSNNFSLSYCFSLLCETSLRVKPFQVKSFSQGLVLKQR